MFDVAGLNMLGFIVQCMYIVLLPCPFLKTLNLKYIIKISNLFCINKNLTKTKT